MLTGCIATQIVTPLNLLEAFNTETNTVHATKLQIAVLNQVSTINNSNVLYSVLIDNVLL